MKRRGNGETGNNLKFMKRGINVVSVFSSNVIKFNDTHGNGTRH